MSGKTWPEFLDVMDTNPSATFDGFYRLAWKALSEVPPRPMRGLSRADLEDLIHDIVYHCVRDDFRVLRRYVDRGKPFVAWLYTVAHHRCLDHIRTTKAGTKTVSMHGDSDGKGLEKVLSNPADNPARRTELRGAVDALKSILAQMGEYCRLLLEMAADELTPQEMLVLMRLPADQNKKVSDDLRYCRKKLRKRLAEVGLDVLSLMRG